MSSEIDINNLRELHAATTQGEWKRNSHAVTCGERLLCTLTVFREGDEHIDNAAFIAAAHNAMPALLGELERLRATELWRSIADAARWPEGCVVVERQVYADESLGMRYFQLHEFWRPDLRVSHTEWLLTQGVISEFKLIAEVKGGE